MKYLVLIETSGNQRYIFSTNKLRENVGASELTYKIGAEFAKNLAESTNGIERIITTSGKALLLADDESMAKNFVKEVTLHALKKMPGLTINGAICKVKNDSDKTEAENFHKAVGDVHKRLEEIRYQIPSNLQRFQRIPFVAECASSNLPAEKTYVHESIKTKEDKRPHSTASITKQEESNNGKQRLEETIRKIEDSIYFAKNSNDLDKRFEETKWFAVIHADGNGLGQIFLDFQNKAKAKDRKEYCEKHRKFSVGLDECTINATAFALKNLQTAYRANRKDKNKDSIEVPAIPLVLGGDDLTIICDGQYAIKFTKDFLNKFVEETKTNSKIKEVFTIDGELKEISLGICAGIAIIKPKFPFHQAYSLAEQLLQSAKKTKLISTSLSAFDYHVLYDSSGTTLEEIREKTPFVARPYIVTPKETAKNYTDDQKNQDWIENHHFCELAKRVKVMTAKDEDAKNQLPNSQMHVLREGLFVADTTLNTQKEVDARAKLISHRYPSFKDLLVKDETLFFDEAGEKLTHFLDALDIVEFWK